MMQFFTSPQRSAILALSLLIGAALDAQSISKERFAGGADLPHWVEFSEGLSASALPQLLHRQLDWPKNYGLTPQGKPYTDKLGYSHQRFQQTYDGVPVFGATVAVHSLNDQVRKMNGDLLEAKPNAAASAPQLPKDEAIAAAKRYIGARSYMWESPEMEAFIKREQQDPDASFYPTAALVYYPLSFPALTGELRLAYQLDVYAMSPRSRQYVLVDARTGEVLASYQRMHDIDEPGTAMTAYSGLRPIVTNRTSGSGPYLLKDLSRGGGIITYDCLNTASYSGAQVPQSGSNDWDLGSVYGNSILDAHWGTEHTYDYYHDEHNWNSYDNNDSPMLSYAHFNLVAFGYSNNNNAFWDGSRMTYGDGDGTTLNPLTALDVTGHEITHGVTENSAGLVYQDEAGALNESYSDIMGNCIEFHAKPEGFSWMIGSDMSVSGIGFRDMSNPNLNGNPDTYHGDFWYFGMNDHGGVHTNSGVQNFWFYLLSEGGTGTNDIGNNYNVQGIGIEDAGDIVFRTLTMYMNANSDYADARDYSIQSATELFGGCSPEVIAVTNAWYAVGVGGPFTDAVVAGFSPSAMYSCSVPATFQFANTTLNAGSYLWDFGDGSTSTAASPLHTYTSTGNYTVTLVANGTTLCNNSDTLVFPQPLIVEDNGALATPACQPIASNSPLSADAGIFRFKFGTIDKTSTGAQDGYQDFSCEQVAAVTEGLSYPLNVVLHIPGYVAVWIDLNNDGAFGPSERVYHSPGASMTHTADVIIPAASIFGTHLRMRVVNDTQPLTSSCSTADGQAEDYAVVILDNMQPPIAAFTATPITVLVDGTVSFQDLSLNAPTQWEWAFTGGNIAASVLQAPQVSYATIGDYDVQLIVSNAHGSDTLLLAGFIHVVNSFNLCQVTSTNASSGTFYDSGGATGVYGNNETCTLLIAPPCASNITLSFQSFQTENNYDYMRVYNGSSASAPSIGVFSGNTVPGPITSTGGQIFIKWSSDQNTVTSGFEVRWTSQAASQDVLNTVASANDLNPAFGQAVQFTDNSVETPYTWNWDFGDGTTSTVQNPVHSYLSSGPKTVVLTASNCVSTDTDTLYLHVQPSSTANVTPGALLLQPASCQDTVQASFTLYNTGGGPLLWTLGSEITDNFEGAGYNTAMWGYSNGHNSADCGAWQGATSHHFTSGGSRRIESLPAAMNGDSHFAFHMIYGSGGNCEDVDEGEYVVLEYSLDGSNWTVISSYSTIADYFSWTAIDEHMPPAAQSAQTRLRLRQVANSGSPYDVWAIDEAKLYTAYSGLLVPTPQAGTIAPGDSITVTVLVSTAGLPPGSHQETLHVNTNDPMHPQVDMVVTIVVPDEPCALFNFEHVNGCLGEVQFTNATLHDPGVWHWDFGDGATSQLENPLHIYSTAGDFNVMLTAGTGSQSGTYSSVVHAEPIAASFTHTDPDADNGTVIFTPDAPGAVQWHWDFGDGMTSDAQTPTHTYAGHNSYTVTLTVMNGNGCPGISVVTLQFGPDGISEQVLGGISIMPNPNRGRFIIRAPRLGGLAEGTITDAMGRRVLDIPVISEGDTPIDIGQLADGIYVLRLQKGAAVRHVRIAKQ